MGIRDLITFAPLPDDQFVNKAVEKDQLFIHHTASSGSPYGVMEWWQSNKERVGTAFIIAHGNGKNYKDGEIIQCFNSKKCAWHLGLKAKDLVKDGRSSTDMNFKSVGVELCSWGELIVKNGKFYNYDGGIVAESEITEYSTPFRGYKFYQKYTTAQLDSMRQLLVYLCDTYDIDKKWKGMEMFNIDKRCLMGERGVWSHVSVRRDKVDCHPQPELIQLLQSL